VQADKGGDVVRPPAPQDVRASRREPIGLDGVGVVAADAQVAEARVEAPAAGDEEDVDPVGDGRPSGVLHEARAEALPAVVGMRADGADRARAVPAAAQPNVPHQHADERDGPAVVGEHAQVPGVLFAEHQGIVLLHGARVPVAEDLLNEFHGASELTAGDCFRPSDRHCDVPSRKWECALPAPRDAVGAQHSAARLASQMPKAPPEEGWQAHGVDTCAGGL
jgi:hypothetical protein